MLYSALDFALNTISTMPAFRKEKDYIMTLARLLSVVRKICHGSSAVRQLSHTHRY
jgi:hypothetical protein